MGTTDRNISVTCVCAVCGAILDVRPAFDLWPSTYAVSICWKCLEVEREKAFKDGYEKGYDEGYDDWVDDLVSNECHLSYHWRNNEHKEE